MKLSTAEAVKTAMLEKLAGSLLNATDVTKLKLKPLTAAQVKPLDLPCDVAGFLIPYFSLDGKPTSFWRLRYLEDTRKGFDVLNGRKALRYVQPGGGVNEVYLPPFIDWRRMAENVEIPIVITEGELKAACATKLKIPTIGLGGVYSFKSTKNVISLLPMLRQFQWKGRRVIICYDSDAVTNPKVVTAENQLARKLTEEGADVSIARLPPDGENKVGIDDFLLKNTVDDFMEIIDAASSYQASWALHEMNEMVAYIRNPGFVYDFVNDMRLGCEPFVRHSYSTYWHDEPVGEKMAKKQTALVWLQWKHRTELDKVTFAPGKPKTTDNMLNLWNGWPIEPKKGSVKLWHQLLDHLFQGAEPGARQWFEQWCAYPLQHPGAKMASAACFWGVIQGSGKTMVGHSLMRIYGSYSAEVNDDELEDPRMDWAENLQFVLADDITSNDNRKLANRLKTMITQKTLRINQKYIPRYSVPDCINYYFTGNAPDTFYLEDDDRRNFIHEVIAGKLEVEFRRAYIAWRDSDEGTAALFHYLLELDLDGFDPQAEAFQTQAKKDMIQLTKSDIGGWVYDLHANFDRVLKMPGDLFTASELLAMYDPMKQGRVTANGLARELKKAGFRAPGISGSMTITKFGNVRLYAIKNKGFWQKQKTKVVVEHYENNRTADPSAKKSTKVKF